MPVHKGSCHCGAVSFEVTAPAVLSITDCNCSICLKSGFSRSLIVDRPAFNLLSGEDRLTTYTFNTHKAKHTFCQVCGVKSFYTPRSNPNGVGINLNCLDKSNVEGVEVDTFDGVNWEKNIKSFRHAESGAE
eukprot:TRINITY_DN2610_c0_g1_i2.p1 TRINITY_DN2610_c0_g1~~TRINITY_DN2610_c0_g1_i2.p1  ORF type:complete len:132 (-),score=13.72 TRINITY_DN2610_c0_g1_i2:158-553(-)